jgi:hypothetical protein
MRKYLIRLDAMERRFDEATNALSDKLDRAQRLQETIDSEVAEVVDMIEDWEGFDVKFDTLTQKIGDLLARPASAVTPAPVAASDPSWLRLLPLCPRSSTTSSHALPLPSLPQRPSRRPSLR